MIFKAIKNLELIKRLTVLASVITMTASLISCNNNNIDEISAEEKVSVASETIEFSEDTSVNKEIIKQLKKETRELIESTDNPVVNLLTKTPDMDDFVKDNLYKYLGEKYKKEYIERYLELKYEDYESMNLPDELVYFDGYESLDSYIAIVGPTSSFGVYVDNAGNIGDTRSIKDNQLEEKISEMIKDELNSSKKVKCSNVTSGVYFGCVPSKEYKDIDEMDLMFSEKNSSLLAIIELDTTDTFMTDTALQLVKRAIPSSVKSGYIEVRNKTDKIYEYTIE